MEEEPETERVVERNFSPDPESLRFVREFLRESLSGRADLDDVVLVVSELATNVVRHARTIFTVEVCPDPQTLRLNISDGSSVVPAIEDLADSSRGLRLIETLTDRWGIESTDTGKTIWVEFDRDSPAEPPRAVPG